MTAEERLREWPQQFLREGREQGIAQGLEHERGLLRRMAARRFGAETGERLAAALAAIADADDLAGAGDWLVQCEDGAEFLAHVQRIARS